jgi:hypothetical protein
MDRPAVFVRTAFPDEDPTYDRMRAYLAANTELKGAWWLESPTKWPSENVRETGPGGFERRVHIIHTPKGDLRSSSMHRTKGDPGQTEEYCLKSAEDVEKFLSLPEHELGSDVSGFFAAVKKMGETGIVEASVGSPIGNVVPWFGSELFAEMSLTHRDLIHAMLDRFMRSAIANLKYIIQAGVGPYFNMLGEEYVVPPLHGPKDFQDFVVRYEKPLCDIIHEAGGFMHVHCHGSIRKVFSGFLDMGVDVLHPFEAPPMGDITAADAKAMAGSRICLEGNIQISDFYDKPADWIAAQTASLIRDAFGDRQGLIVCPTASPYIRHMGDEAFPRFKAMIDTVLEWKA